MHFNKHLNLLFNLKESISHDEPVVEFIRVSICIEYLLKFIAVTVDINILRTIEILEICIVVKIVVERRQESFSNKFLLQPLKNNKTFKNLAINTLIKEIKKYEQVFAKGNNFIIVV